MYSYIYIHIYHSPFPSIPSRHGIPLTEFVTADWVKPNGHLRNKVAIVDAMTGQARTFREYYNDMGGLAANLRYELGVRDNTTVALFSPNHVDYMPICLATALCGAKLTPINPAYKASGALLFEFPIRVEHWIVP